MRKALMAGICIWAGCVSNDVRDAEEELTWEREGAHGGVPVGPPEEFHGYFSFVGGEWRTFRPAESDEEWWVDWGPLDMFDRYYEMQRNARNPQLEVYVAGVGRKSGLGAWGHLSSYNRFIVIDRLDVMDFVAPPEPPNR